MTKLLGAHKQRGGPSTMKCGHRKFSHEIA